MEEGSIQFHEGLYISLDKYLGFDNPSFRIGWQICFYRSLISVQDDISFLTIIVKEDVTGTTFH